jgi:signal transduction histidine kinase
MVDHLVQDTLTSLHEALQRLRSMPLPDEGYLAIQEADRSLKEVAAEVEALSAENARLNQAVQQANLARSRFVSSVTHEIRVPMTSIKGYTDLLRQGVIGPVNEQQLNFLNTIRNNVERMSTLVSNLSDISHIETGRLKLQLADIYLRISLEEALNSFNPKLAEKEQILTVDLPANLPPIRADSIRLVQVLHNLLSNAHKYTPPKGKITIHASPIGSFVRVEVSDTGIGIRPEDQSLLFTQFFRSEDPAVREQQGWGLGLCVAKRLVDIMGGEVGVQSQVGEGSTFWFTVPVSVRRSQV